MTHEQALNELNELRGMAQDSANLADFKQRVRALYLLVIGKSLRDCNCKDVYKDALIEIYVKLQKSTDMELNTKARLVNGVVLQHKGNHYTNANLTDEVAREFLELFPQREDWFAVLPQKAAEETREERTESVAEAIKAPSKPTTPKKKKTAKKAK